MVVREIVIKGYNPALGIKHSSKFNNNNLTYDLMEPFRPFVDKVVYNTIISNGILNNEFKNLLIGFQYEDIKYNGKVMECGTAITLYVDDVLKNIGNRNFKIKKMEFINA